MSLPPIRRRFLREKLCRGDTGGDALERIAPVTDEEIRRRSQRLVTGNAQGVKRRLCIVRFRRRQPREDRLASRFQIGGVDFELLLSCHRLTVLPEILADSISIARPTRDTEHRFFRRISKLDYAEDAFAAAILA